MGTLVRSIHIPKIPTLDEVEAAGAWNSISLDGMLFDFARSSKDSRQVGELWPQGDGSSLRVAVQHWLGQEM
jgi:hypothetical protein